MQKMLCRIRSGFIIPPRVTRTRNLDITGCTFKPSVSIFFLPFLVFLFYLSLSKRARASLRITQLRTANRVNAYGDRACPYYQATTGV